MRRARAIFAGFGLALLAAGCDTTDMRFFRYGVGTDLYSSDIVETTQYQDLYLSELCRQSLPILSRAAAAECQNAALMPNDWALIVQAGFNDIDRRCDAYLAWLDDRRRTNSSILKQLGDTTVAAQGIMRLAGVGADPITMAGLAFGFATNTFTNINSRLLLEVDKTTVQTLVIRRRSVFRMDPEIGRVTNRPAAIHALRLYLTICTPFAIETDINSTVTVFQQAGPGALANSPPLFSPATIAPLRSTTFIDTPPVRQQKPPTVVPTIQAMFEAYDPKRHTPGLARSIASKLCLKDTDVDIVPRTMAAIQVFQMVLQIEGNLSGVQITGKLTSQELSALNDAGPCDRKRFLNYYEASKIWPGGISNLGTIPLVNRALPEDRRMVRNTAGVAPVTPDSEVRKRIADVRLSLASGLKLRSAELVEQLTPDLIELLRKLPIVQSPTAGAPAPAPTPGAAPAPANGAAPAPANGAAAPPGSTTTTTTITIPPAPGAAPAPAPGPAVVPGQKK